MRSIIIIPSLSLFFSLALSSVLSSASTRVFSCSALLTATTTTSSSTIGNTTTTVSASPPRSESQLNAHQQHHRHHNYRHNYHHHHQQHRHQQAASLATSISTVQQQCQPASQSVCLCVFSLRCSSSSPIYFVFCAKFPLRSRKATLSTPYSHSHSLFSLPIFSTSSKTLLVSSAHSLHLLFFYCTVIGKFN